MTDEEGLLDYRRSVAALYARVRQPNLDAAESCQRFRQERDALFRSHPQSALSNEQKADFRGLRYYDYNPAFRFLLPIDPIVVSEVLEVELEHERLAHRDRDRRCCAGACADRRLTPGQTRLPGGLVSGPA